MKYMTNVLSVVNGVFTQTIRRLYPEFTQLTNSLQYSGAKFGDYKCMAAMPISQVWPCCILYCVKEVSNCFFS